MNNLFITKDKANFLKKILVKVNAQLCFCYDPRSSLNKINNNDQTL